MLRRRWLSVVRRRRQPSSEKRRANVVTRRWLSVVRRRRHLSSEQCWANVATRRWFNFVRRRRQPSSEQRRANVVTRRRRCRSNANVCRRWPNVSMFAPFLYEVASHVKNCHSGHYYRGRTSILFIRLGQFSCKVVGISGEKLVNIQFYIILIC